MGRRLCAEMEQEAMRLARKGYSFAIGRQRECSRHAVTNILIRVPIRPVSSKWNPCAARLSMKEREEIRAGLERGGQLHSHRRLDRPGRLHRVT